jgi:hypothetical protein
MENKTLETMLNEMIEFHKGQLSTHKNEARKRKIIDSTDLMIIVLNTLSDQEEIIIMELTNLLLALKRQNLEKELVLK